MRTNHVKSARKPRTCERCGKDVPVGSGYKWIKPRYGRRRERCATCPDWRASERTGSEKLARVFAAQEAIEDAMAAFDGTDVTNLREALEEAATEAEEVAQEYSEAADACPAGREENEERAEQISSWGSECDSAAGNVDDFRVGDVRKQVRDGLMAENHANYDATGKKGTGRRARVESATLDEAAVEEAVRRKQAEWAGEVRSSAENALDGLDL